MNNDHEKEAHEWHFGLIGFPLGHSLSPQLHQAALHAAGLHGSYRLLPIPPLPEGEAQIAFLMDALRQGAWDGLNVTIPHKLSVLPYLDEISPVARAVGAVNTLFCRADRLIGENTDVPGFQLDLRDQLNAQPGDGWALVLGAGGSARAVVYALLQLGWQVRIFARRMEQAASLAADFSGAQVLPGLSPLPEGCGLIVNTTPLGMYPHPEGCPLPDDAPFPPRAAIYDLVYRPAVTRLVQRARLAGLRAASGGGMLAAQAALGFAHWTGLPAPFSLMRAVISAELSENSL